jgi:hypothetical protein
MLSQVFHVRKVSLNSSKILPMELVRALGLNFAFAVVPPITYTEHKVSKYIDNETL